MRIGSANTQPIYTPGSYIGLQQLTMSTKGLPANGRSKVYDRYGKCVIPKAVRDELGIEMGDEIEFLVDGDSIKAYKVEE